MIKKEYIYNVKKALIESPLRERLGDNDNLPFKDLISKNLNKVMANIEILEKKEGAPLKVVIVGEVKSGKSSLLNALLSKEVSEVDVLEATSSIIEVVYDKERSIKKLEGITRIGLKIDYLKHINLVDTPGLRSITVKNERKTLNYIQNADLILFVFDATHIGQEDVNEVLDLLSSYKKTIVGIINKSDLLEDNKDEVMEYMKDEYGIYIEDFFMISSYLEYQDKVSKNAKVGSTDIVISTYTDLKENFIKLSKYIDEVCKDCENIKLESVNASIEGVVHKDIVYHYDYSKSVGVVVEELRKHEKLLFNKLDYITSKMDFEINDWINRFFLSEEINRIKEDIDNIDLYINEGYINDLVNNKKEELDKIFLKEWSECLQEVNDEIDQSIKKYMENIDYRNELVSTPPFKINYDKTNIGELLATVGTGAILGATSATVVSAYAAGLGTSATSLTMGAALMTYCPPLLIAGTVTGAIGKLLYDKVKIDKKNKEILSDIDDFRENLKFKISESLKVGYANSSREIVNTTAEVYRNSKGIQIQKYEIENLLEEIERYLVGIKQYVNN